MNERYISNLKKIQNNQKFGSSANLTSDNLDANNQIKLVGDIHFVIRTQYIIKIPIDFNKNFEELRTIFFQKINRTDLIHDKSITLSLENKDIDPKKIIKENNGNKINANDLQNISETEDESINSNIKKITFQVTRGEKIDIEIELNKTLKDLRISYFNKIKRPDLIKNDKIVFLFNGNNLSLKPPNDLIEKHIKKDDKNVVILVSDLTPS